jgi:hypothetical protein
MDYYGYVWKRRMAVLFTVTCILCIVLVGSGIWSKLQTLFK